MPRAWFDPHPSDGDIQLLPRDGVPIVFRTVPLDTKTLYGDATFRMGSSREQLFEAPVDVRISSPISGTDGRRTLLIGKYEITKAQYIYTMGSGDPRLGLQHLIERTGELRVAGAAARAAACDGVNSELRQMLAEPVTYLTYSDYVAFVDAANLACIADAACAERMRGFSANREVIAFLRLPLEHEWEYVARRGGALADKQISREVMQSELPDFGDGLTLADVAHLGRDPDRVIPIGSRRAVDGVYDIFGNAAELMQNAFTSEIGYGAVGGYVARGGHFRLTAPEVRVSMRSELLPFRVDDDTGEIAGQKFQHVGLRLALALPVAGSAERTGSDELAAEFNESFTEVATARDAGGDSIGEAGDLGVVTGSDIVLRDRVSDEDQTDVVKVTLGVPADLSVSLDGVSGTRLALSTPAGKVLNEVVLTGGKSWLSVSNLLPGPYFVTVAAGKDSGDAPYVLRVTRDPLPDTGIAYPTEEALRSEVPSLTLSGNSGNQILEGYVGTGDTTDHYVIENISFITGLALSVDAPEAERLTIRLLDDRLRMVAEISPSADGRLPPLPITGMRRAILQIEAPDTTAQRYVLRAGLTDKGGKIAGSQTEAMGDAPLVSGERIERLLDPTRREAHFRLVLQERKGVRVELSGFSVDLDLRVRNQKGEDQSRTHLRKGLETEVFVQDLEPGTYYLRVANVNAEQATAFSLVFEASEPAVAPPKTMAEVISKPLAKIAASGGGLTGQKVNGMVAVHVFKRSDQSVRVTVKGFSARSNLDIRAVVNSDEIIASSSNPGASPETLEVGPGATSFYLIIEAMGQQSTDSFSVEVSPFSGPVAFNPTEYGQKLLSTHGDWIVTRDENNNCWASTGWQSMLPDDELLFTWAPAMQVRYTAGVDGVYFPMLLRNEETDTITASLEVESGGRWRTGNSAWEGYALRPTVVEKGKSVIDADTTKLFTSGTRARIVGTYKGKSFEVNYSLRGYAAANREANRVCGAKSAWVVR